MMMGIIIMILESAALPNGSKVVAVSRWKYGYTKVWKHEGVEAQKYGSTKVTFSGQLTTDIGRLDQLKFINGKKEVEHK